MMRIAVYARKYHPEFRNEIQVILEFAEHAGGFVMFNNSLKKQVTSYFSLPKNTQFYSGNDVLKGRVDLVISLGGDGTLLETVNLIKDGGIPVMGVNFGRLGFLSNISREDLRMTLESFAGGQCTISPRTMLMLENSKDFFGEEVYALNDLALHKSDSSSMITVHVHIDGEFMNSYWSDGLILATPTGSTAYSLSCGGPILVPEATNFVLTPIAPHNLTVRPLIIKDDAVLKLIPDGRADSFILSMDSRQCIIQKNQEIIVKKAPFKVNFVQVADSGFFGVIRDKLMWGQDKRN